MNKIEIEKRDTVIILSDFEIDQWGRPMTGYSNIACSLAKEIHKDYNLINLGIGYGRNQHFYPFYISNVTAQHAPASVSIIAANVPTLKSIIMIMDIPMMNMFRERMEKIDKIKTIGIFAVEGDPLIFTWAKGLMNLSYRYAISQFGVEECKKSYVGAEHFIVPINRELWKPRTVEDKTESKKSHGLSDKKVVFYNADSNERKNTSALLQAIAIANKIDPKIHLVLLTRKYSPVGWNYDDFINEFQLQNCVTVVDRGNQSLGEVWNLYASAELYVQPSKSEGCGIPILEAMSIGIPVIATDCTAMHEHLFPDRGILISPDFIHRDVFGNTNRYYLNPEKLADIIVKNIDRDHTEMIQKASAYIEDRNAQFPLMVGKMKEKINGK